jgi:hypothetical protein
MRISPIHFLLALLAGLSYSITWSGESLSIRHKVVAVEKDRFHGWPANNGVWRWDNEILVAFTQGDFVFRKGHNIGGRQDTLLARSRDGGETWKMFDPEGFLDDDHEEKFQGEGKEPLTEPMDFSNPGFALRIFATGYHGNDDPEGGFFYSNDRGATWNGPHTLTGLSDHPEMKDKVMCPRTDYLILSEKKCFIFVGAQESREAPSRIACIQTDDGGLSFDFVSWVTPANADFRAIMSQTVQTGNNEFVLAYRKIYRSDTTFDTIETYGSKDGAQTWEVLGTVKTMKTSSNPPALVKLQDGRLCCAYGDRHVGEIRARYSADGGATWGPESIVRDDFKANEDDEDTQRGLNADIGYVRLVQRPDGHLVAMYYWVDADRPQQYIAASIWKP